MPNNIPWLPDLLLWDGSGNTWNLHLESAYAIYKHDFLDSRPRYRGTAVGVKRLPILDGKESGFWHLIQEGAVEEDRVPNLRRLERVRWPRPVIEHDRDQVIRAWRNVRHTKVGIQKNICLWLEESEYLVVLRIRNNGLLFWTAYPVTEDHKKRKLAREYEESKKTGDAISSDPDTPSTRGR
jgi:hypothetical protein